MIASTRSACSASARTAGSAAASSPETISRPIGSGFSSSASEHAAQASATPRAFGVAGRWNAAQPGFASSPSRWPSSASRAPPPPPRPDQIRTARSEAATRSSSFLPSFGSATLDDLGAVAARLADPEIDDRRPVGDLLVADDDDDLGGADASRAARGRRRARARPPRAGPPSARRGPGAATSRARTPARPSPSRRAPSRSGPPPRAAATRPGRSRRPTTARRSPGAARAPAGRRSGRRA